MGLSHPPGWDNISPDVKIGVYSCLKSEKISRSNEILKGSLNVERPFSEYMYISTYFSNMQGTVLLKGGD